MVKRNTKKLAKRRVVKKAAKKKVKVLPKKLSKLLKVAMTDLKKAEKAEQFIIEMGTWFEPNIDVRCTTGNGTVVKQHKACAVCFAGSVMAMSLGAKGNNDLEPHHFPENESQLQALNLLRTGSLCEAYRCVQRDYFIDIPKPVLTLQRKLDGAEVSEYNALNPKPFHDAMEKLEKDLIKIGY